MLLVPVAALSQGASAPAAEASPVMAAFLLYAVPTLFTGLATALVWEFTALARKLTADGQVNKAGEIASRALHFVFLVVRELEQTIRPEIQAITADGKISAAERERLKSTALTKVKALLGEHGIKELQALAGIAAPQVEANLSGLIESSVLDLRHREDSVAALVTPAMVPSRGWSARSVPRAI
jgi:hypothetical protein